MWQAIFYFSGVAIGYFVCAILTASKIADLEAFGDECGEIILKQKDEIDRLNVRV